MTGIRTGCNAGGPTGAMEIHVWYIPSVVLSGIAFGEQVGRRGNALCRGRGHQFPAFLVPFLDELQSRPELCLGVSEAGGPEQAFEALVGFNDGEDLA